MLPSNFLLSLTSFLVVSSISTVLAQRHRDTTAGLYARDFFDDLYLTERDAEGLANDFVQQYTARNADPEPSPEFDEELVSYLALRGLQRRGIGAKVKNLIRKLMSKKDIANKCQVVQNGNRPFHRLMCYDPHGLPDSYDEFCYCLTGLTQGTSCDCMGGHNTEPITDANAM